MADLGCCCTAACPLHLKTFRLIQGPISSNWTTKHGEQRSIQVFDLVLIVIARLKAQKGEFRVVENNFYTISTWAQHEREKRAAHLR